MKIKQICQFNKGLMIVNEDNELFFGEYVFKNKNEEKYEYYLSDDEIDNYVTVFKIKKVDIVE